jgi:predicted NAD-dependent protein-ADP-ribosyltransferase YbiA (DUF1768 family)
MNDEPPSKKQKSWFQQVMKSAAEDDRFVFFDRKMSDKTFYPFSNFYNENGVGSFTYGRYSFATGEHYLMYMKAVTFAKDKKFNTCELFQDIQNSFKKNKKLIAKYENKGWEQFQAQWDEYGELNFPEAILILGKDPLRAKNLGRQVPNFDDAQWTNEMLGDDPTSKTDDDDDDETPPNQKAIFGLMAMGLLRKALDNPSIYALLMGTGNKVIVEAASRDRIWGAGAGFHTIKAERKYPGTNLLGRSWMGARAILREQEARKV